MSTLHSKSSNQLKRLCGLIALLAGMLIAPSIRGQEILDPEILAPKTIATEVIGQEIIGQTMLGQTQVVMTKKNCLRATPVCVSENDEVWLVSARQSHLNPCDLSLLQCCRLENSYWVASEISELVDCHTMDKTRTTMIFAHGNRTNATWAQSRGLQFYQNAFQTNISDRPPVRFVIFTWKAEVEVRRPLLDFKIKSQRSCKLGQLMGNFLDEFDDQNILVSGFSLGGQIILSGISNLDSSEEDLASGRYQVALFAPVFNSSFACPGMENFLCNPTVGQTTVFMNYRDRAVKVASRIERRNNRRSLSTIGQLTSMWYSGSDSIRISDITNEVGHRHSVVKYAKSPTLRCELVEMLYRVYLASNPAIDASPELNVPELNAPVDVEGEGTEDRDGESVLITEQLPNE